MLPFMKPKIQGSVIMMAHKPDGSNEVKGEEGQPNPALMAIAEDLISAIHSKDAMAVAHALDAAIQISDEDEGSEPMEGIGE